MKVKLDENLHIAVAAVFADSRHDVDTIAGEDLLGADDPSVLAAARMEARLMITLDRGFGDIRSYPPGTHAGILVLRMDDHSFPATRTAIEQILENVDLDDLSGCVAVYRNGDLRIRRPPSE